MENEKQKPKKIDLSNLLTPGGKKSAPRVPEKKAAHASEETPKEIIYENEGGKKVGHPVPENEVRFESIGGKVVRRSPHFLHLPEPSAALTESEGEED